MNFLHTPRSTNSLFCDLFRNFTEVIVGGAPDYLGVSLEGHLRETARRQAEKDSQTDYSKEL